MSDFAFGTELIQRERGRNRCRAKKIVLVYGHTPHSLVDACITAISATGYSHILVGKDTHPNGNERLFFACFADAALSVETHNAWDISHDNQLYSPQRYRVWSASDAIKYVAKNRTWEMYTANPAWRQAFQAIVNGDTNATIPRPWAADASIWMGKGNQLFNGGDVDVVIVHDSEGTWTRSVGQLSAPHQSCIDEVD